MIKEKRKPIRMKRKKRKQLTCEKQEVGVINSFASDPAGSAEVQDSSEISS